MFVPYETWKKILSLFPNARRHVFGQHLLHSLTATAVASDDIVCSICRGESDADRQSRQRLKDIAKSCRKALEASEILSSSELQGLSSAKAGDLYFAIHENDLELWKKFALTVQRSDSKTGESLEQFVQLYFRSNGWLPKTWLECSEPDRKRVERVFSYFRPMLCQRHGCPVGTALFLDPSTNGTPNIRQDVLFLNDQDYQTFLVHVFAITFVVQPDQSTDDRDGNLDKHEAAQFIDRLNLSRSIHPSFRPRTLFDKGDIGNGEHGPNSTDLSALVCRDEICANAQNEWVLQKASMSQKRSNGKRGAQDGIGSASDDPIILDSDDEKGERGNAEAFVLRVFDVCSGSGEAEIRRSAEQCMAWSGDESLFESTFLRRSSRKRKTRFPQGAILEEDTMRMTLKNNIAALRLCLVERCVNGSFFEVKHKLALVVRRRASGPPLLVDVDAEDDTSEVPKPFGDTTVIPLPFDQNLTTLQELCESNLDPELVKSPDFDPADSIALLRISDVDETSKEYAKDSLMEHLIELSNVASASSNGKNSKKRSRAAERGFTGTFLSSASHAGDMASPDETAAAPGESSKPLSVDEPLEEDIVVLKVTEETENPRKRPSPIDVERKVVDKPQPRSRVERVDLGIEGNASVLESIFRSPKHEVASSESDDSLTDIMNAPALNSKKAKVSPRCDTRMLGLQLQELLRQNPDVTDLSASYKAAMWAAEKGNPNGEVEPAKLLDLAYCKYIENCDQ